MKNIKRITPCSFPKKTTIINRRSMFSILSFFLVIVAAMSVITGCGSVKTYTDSANSFSIDIPGTWETDTDVNDGEIVLSSSDGLFTVIMQRFSKANLNLNGLDEFVGMYKESAMPQYLNVPIATEPVNEKKGFTISDAEIYDVKYKDLGMSDFYSSAATPASGSGSEAGDANAAGTAAGDGTDSAATSPNSGSKAGDANAAVTTEGGVTNPAAGDSADADQNSSEKQNPDSAGTTTDGGVSTPSAATNDANTEPGLKTCVIYIESENSFYVYSFTGNYDSFEVNKSEMISALSSLKETAA